MASSFFILDFSFPHNYNSNCLNSNILSIVSARSAMLPVRTAWTLPARHKRRNIPMYAQKLSFHYLSMSVHAMFHRRLLDSLKCRQLTAGQPKVLDYLQDHNGATQKEIAAACHIEPGSLTAVLNRMEQKNMIQRRMLGGNRRSLHVFLTPSGRRDQEAVRDAFLRLEEQVFQGIAEEDREVFMRIFQRIYDNLSEGGR